MHVSSTCTANNWYKTISSSQVTAVDKFNTGTDAMAIALTISSMCRIIILDRDGAKTIESSIGDASTEATVCNKIKVDSTGNIYVVGNTVGLDASTSGQNLMVGKWDTNDMSQTWALGWGGYNGDEVSQYLKQT